MQHHNLSLHCRCEVKICALSFWISWSDCFHVFQRQRSLLILISISSTKTTGFALNLWQFIRHPKPRRESSTIDLFLWRDFSVHPAPEPYSVHSHHFRHIPGEFSRLGSLCASGLTSLVRHKRTERMQLNVSLCCKGIMLKALIIKHLWKYWEMGGTPVSFLISWVPGQPCIPVSFWHEAVVCPSSSVWALTCK